jgi:hypothetical protein
MRRSHTPFLKWVLNPLARVVVVPKVSLVTEINDIPEFAGGTTGGHLDNAECGRISLMDATEMGNDSVDRGRFIEQNNTGLKKRVLSVVSVESSNHRLRTRYQLAGVV